MVAGDKRRRVEDVERIDHKDLEKICERIDSERDACLISLLYLSARRINEVLPLRKQDFKVEEKRISFETFNEKVYRKKQTGNFTIHLNDRFYERIRPHWRTDSESGKTLTKHLLKRLGSLSEKDHLFKAYTHKDYPISRSMAYRIVRFYIPDAWPHLLRHERFTEIARVYKDDPVAMHRYTFHKRFESTLKYIRDLEEERI